MSSEEDTRDRLARMETKLDLVVEELVERVKDHETRLRLNEKWRYALPTALVFAVVSLVVTLLTSTPSPH